MTVEDKAGLTGEQKEIIAEHVRGAIAEPLQTALKTAIAEEFDKRSEVENQTALDNMSDKEFTRQYTNPFVERTDRKIENKEDDRGMLFTKFLQFAARSGNNPVAAAQMAAAQGYKDVARALNESVFSAGGLLVPDEVSSDIIELLRDATVVMLAGARQVNMPSGSLELPYEQTDVSAAYIGELSNIPSSQPSWESMLLVAKKLVALVPFSNDLMDTADRSIDSYLRGMIVKQFATRRDLAFLRGDGTSNTPKGIVNVAGSSVVRSQAAFPSTVAEITDDLCDLIEVLEGQNIPLMGAGYVMTSRTRSGLMRLRTALGEYAFRDELKDGTLNGYPVYVTNALPNNTVGAGGPGIGGLADKSEIIFCAFPALIIGQTKGIELEFARNVAYHDGSSVVSGFSSDQSAIRGIERHDIGFSYRGREAAVLTAVDWGLS